MTQISSHVLDTTLGRPAAGLEVRLAVLDDSAEWRNLGAAITDEKGRVRDLLAGATLEPRRYRLSFETEAYFVRHAQPVFYPRIEVVFIVTEPREHYHVPVLLNPFGYSTYRGS